MKRAGKRIFAGIRVTPNSSRVCKVRRVRCCDIQSVWIFRQRPLESSTRKRSIQRSQDFAPFRVYYVETRPHKSFAPLFAVLQLVHCNAHLRTLLSILITGKWCAYIQREQDVILPSKMYITRYRTLFNKITRF